MACDSVFMYRKTFFTQSFIYRVQYRICILFVQQLKIILIETNDMGIPTTKKCRCLVDILCVV